PAAGADGAAAASSSSSSSSPSDPTAEPYMPGPPKFKDGEIVFAHDAGLLYEAKVLSVSTPPEQEPNYLVHYNGWNSRWDKWVVERVLLPDGDHARQLEKELKEKHKVSEGGEKVMCL
ncbi:unnamed protein product, partial [Phaeothamnion confervicola]